MESTSTSNSIHSTMADLLDRCSSPPSLEQEIRSCLNDLCQRVVLMADPALSSMMYNPIPSPVFKRKMEDQSTNHPLSNHVESPTTTTTTPKKKRNRASTKKPSNEIAITLPKKEEPIEPDLADIKPSNVMATPTITSDYICDWENCRRHEENKWISTSFNWNRFDLCLDRFPRPDPFFIMPVPLMWNISPSTFVSGMDASEFGDKNGP